MVYFVDEFSYEFTLVKYFFKKFLEIAKISIHPYLQNIDRIVLLLKKFVINYFFKFLLTQWYIDLNVLFYSTESAAEKAQRIRPSNTVQAPAAHHNTTKSQLRPATALIGRRGKPCSVPNCELFGDPKQNDMCSKHFWSTVGARPQLGRNSSNIRVAGNPYESVHFAMPESMGSACCLQGSISVPPPSFPVAESLASAGNDDFAGLRTTAKFNDAYNRVLQRPEGIPRCNTLGCRNYASKNGLCNSCYSQNSNFEEARRFALLGEDQIG